MTPMLGTRAPRPLAPLCLELDEILETVAEEDDVVDDVSVDEVVSKELVTEAELAKLDLVVLEDANVTEELED